MNSMYHGDMSFTFTTHDYAIGGKLVQGKAKVTEHYRTLMESGDQDAIDELKQDLLRQMLNFMLENKLIEFTWKDDHITGDRIIVLRTFVTPSDQVRILRLANKL
jgi:hypothetical protein